MLQRSIILGTGAYFPPNVVTNEELSKRIDTTDEWIQTRTGIKERRIVSVGMSSSDMALLAAQSAIEKAQISPEDIDLVIVGTVTPDYRTPSTASLIQHRLGAKKAAAFDLAAACAGSLYGLWTASQFIASRACKRVLVIGVETLSSVTNWDDRNTCVLFGDGASAAILGPAAKDDHGFLDFSVHSDGAGWQNIWIPAGGSKTPLTAGLLAEKADRLCMNGKETFKYAVRALADTATALLEKNGLRAKDIQRVVAHQANLRIIQAVADKLAMPIECFVINLDRYANTSTASLLATFDEGVMTGRILAGDKVLLMAVGAGFAWGAGIYEA